MLPHCFPFARIYTYDWNAATISNASAQYFHHHAQELLSAVSREQQNSRSCPIIFIGSCYGGLILAKALCLASNVKGPERQTLYATQGIIFLGTPFRGSRAEPIATMRILIAEAMGVDASLRLVKVLQNETGSLSEIRNHFCSIIRQRWQNPCRVACFFETQPTRILNAIKLLPEAISGLKKMVVSVPDLFHNSQKCGLGAVGTTSAILPRCYPFYTSKRTDGYNQLVDSESACLDGWNQIGLDLAHPGLSKFRGPNDENYKRVVAALEKIVGDEDVGSWCGEAADRELPLDDLPEHQGKSIQHPSQYRGLNEGVTERSANMVKGKPTGQDSQSEETLASTSITSRGHGTTEIQNSTLCLDPAYHEPYRRVPRVPIPSSDEFSLSETSSESPAIKNLGNALLGLSLVALGGIGQSWWSGGHGSTLPSGGYSPQALLGDETRDVTKPKHMDVYSISDTEYQTHGKQGQLEEAENLEVQVMEAHETKLGADHPDTLTSMVNVASTYRSQGRWKEAIYVERDKFRRHVASDMEQLALFAIPQVIEDVDNELASDKPAMNQVATVPSQPDRGPEVNAAELDWQPDPPLHIAAFEGDLDKVRRLILDDGADPDASGETWGTALSAAETGGNAEVVNLLRIHSHLDSSDLRTPEPQPNSAGGSEPVEYTDPTVQINESCDPTESMFICPLIDNSAHANCL